MAMAGAEAGPMKTESRRFDESNRDSLLGRDRENRWDPPVFLKQFDLLFGSTGAVNGAGYTDVNIT